MTEVSDRPNLGDVQLKEKFTSKRRASESLGKMESFFMREKLTDVVLIAGERRIPAHRLVLSAASDYFAAMFTSNLKEASQKEIEMHNIDGDVLHALIKYCYTGEIEFEPDTVDKLLGTACLLQLNEVIEVCSEFIAKRLDPSNCVDIKHFADSLGCTQLLEASRGYTTEHFAEVLQNQEFLKLSADELAELLASDALSVPSEEDVFKGLMSWTENDLSNRREHLSRLLGFIRFPLLSPSFLADHVATNTLIRDLPKFVDLLVENYKYRLLSGSCSKLQSTCPRNYADRLLVFGGYDQFNNWSLSVEKYNANLQEWTEEDKISFVAPSRSGITEFQGKLYFCGGKSDGCSLNVVLCYDMKTKTLTVLPPMLTSRWGLGVAVLKGSLYAVGGQDKSGVLQTVERFDLVRKKWSSVKSKSDKTHSFGLAVLDGKLYAVGGSARTTYSDDVASEMVKYDPCTDNWYRLPSMLYERLEPGVGVLNGLLYAVGGRDYDGTCTNSVERYDPKTNRWMKVAPMKYPRRGTGVYAMGEKLFAVGGYNGWNTLTVVEAYNPRDNVWVEVGSLNEGRHLPVVIGSCIH